MTLYIFLKFEDCSDDIEVAEMLDEYSAAFDIENSDIKDIIEDIRALIEDKLSR